MPIYEYQCRSCGRRSEEFQKMSDPPLTECSECGGELKKLISAPAVQFKGSGWYVTDYADGKKKGAGESASGGESSGDSSGDSSKSSSDSGGAKGTDSSGSSGSSSSSSSGSSSGSSSSSGYSGSSSSD